MTRLFESGELKQAHIKQASQTIICSGLPERKVFTCFCLLAFTVLFGLSHRFVWFVHEQGFLFI